MKHYQAGRNSRFWIVYSIAGELIHYEAIGKAKAQLLMAAGITAQETDEYGPEGQPL